MKSKVIKCPATESERGICVCSPVKCTGSYDADGNRIPVRKSLPYMGIARRALKKIKDTSKTLDKIDHEEVAKALGAEEDK